MVISLLSGTYIAQLFNNNFIYTLLQVFQHHMSDSKVAVDYTPQVIEFCSKFTLVDLTKSYILEQSMNTTRIGRRLTGIEPA
jgi:hypothetical protein